MELDGGIPCKQVLVLPNYRLSTVADYFRLPLNHYEALSDARACGNIASNLLGRVDLKRLVKV
jgi:DNA polymerase-3 subunit epsilon